MRTMTAKEQHNKEVGQQWLGKDSPYRNRDYKCSAQNSYLRSLALKLTNRHRRLTGPDISQKEVLTGLQARALVHEDGGRDHDAPLVHFVLCDTGFNCSWSWRTRRCEVIRIGDRDDAGQVASSMPMRTPVSGDLGIRRHRQFYRPDGKRARQVDHWAQVLEHENEKIPGLRTSCCSSTQV